MNWYCISFATFILSVNCLSIQELIQKVDSSGEPKGTPFEKINGPCKSSKIAIIGAGPSGVHMAYSLKMKGFKDVTILERSDVFIDVSIKVIENIPVFTNSCTARPCFEARLQVSVPISEYEAERHVYTTTINENMRVTVDHSTPLSSRLRYPDKKLCF